MKKVSFITGNADKISEAKSILGDCIEQLDMDLPEVQDIDPKKIITAKLDEARRTNKGSFMVEDTSLFLDCLNGLPGPLIKWFLKAVGNEGLALISQKIGNDKAEAKVIIGYSEDGSGPQFFEGVISGRIVSPRGEMGFGWDPIFQPDGYDKTFAEMTGEAKNSLSMRKIALQRLKDYLQV